MQIGIAIPFLQRLSILFPDICWLQSRFFLLLLPSSFDILLLLLLLWWWWVETPSTCDTSLHCRDVLLCRLSMFGDHNSSRFNSPYFNLSAIQDRSNGSNGGPTQRASALAALNSAFNSSSSPRAVATGRPVGKGQRAAAVAALSSVLTAEKKSPDVSPVRTSRSSRSELSPTGNLYKFTLPSFLSCALCTCRLEPNPFLNHSLKLDTGLIRSRLDLHHSLTHPYFWNVFSASAKAEDASETEEFKLTPKANETEIPEPPTPENEDGSGPKPETPHDEDGTPTTFTYDQLKAKSDNPVKGIDYKRREVFLSTS